MHIHHTSIIGSANSADSPRRHFCADLICCHLTFVFHWTFSTSNLALTKHTNVLWNNDILHILTCTYNKFHRWHYQLTSYVKYAPPSPKKQSSTHIVWMPWLAAFEGLLTSVRVTRQSWTRLGFHFVLMIFMYGHVHDVYNHKSTVQTLHKIN